VERFDENCAGASEQTSRQMAIMVGQVIEFARLRSMLAGLTTTDAAGTPTLI
jgi:hypothetical protein